MGNLLGAIEAGGTKFICAVGTGNGEIRAQIRIDTITPQITMRQVIQFFKEQQNLHGKLSAIGIASFGPLDLRDNSQSYGFITATAKPDWSFFDFVGSIRNEFDIPVGFDTDVNGAALGEWRWGAAQGLDNFIYLTVGTGIGGGGMVNGKLIHGNVHPEMGHVCVPHDYSKDPFEGACPFHKDCLEGLATGPAIEKRWGIKSEQLPVTHEAWDLEAQYLAMGLVNYIYTLSPQRIVLGGGVMKQAQLFPMVRLKVLEIINGYISPELLSPIEQYIVPTQLDSKAGILGAIILAEFSQY